MATYDSSRRPAGGSGVPWWFRWLATVAGAGVFSWALAAILHGGRLPEPPSGSGAPRSLPSAQAPGLAPQSWAATPQDPPGAWYLWEDEEGEWEEEWGEQEWAHREWEGQRFRSDPKALQGSWQGAPRRAPDARSRPS